MKNIDSEAYQKALINYIGPMLKDGIVVDDKTIRFTMLDYYSVTNLDIHELLSNIISNNKKGIKNPYHSYISYFVGKEGLLVRTVDDTDEIVDQHHAFIINGERYEPTEEDIQRLFELFDEYEIPKYDRLIYIALYRKALGIPITPLISDVKEKNKIR